MSDADEITRMIKANFQAFADLNVATMKTMDHPDSTIWDLFEPELFVGEEGRNRFRAKDFDQSRRRGKLTINVEDPVIVKIWDDTAVALYYLNFHYEPPNPMADHVRITDVFQRQNGKWLRRHHHEGSVPKGVPPITEPAPPRR